MREHEETIETEVIFSIVNRMKITHTKHTNTYFYSIIFQGTKTRDIQYLVSFFDTKVHVPYILFIWIFGSFFFF